MKKKVNKNEILKFALGTVILCIVIFNIIWFNSSNSKRTATTPIHSIAPTATIKPAVTATPASSKSTEKNITNMRTLEASLSKVIESSKGFITAISPRENNDDWMYVNATLSDDWYSATDSEKEQLADKLSGIIYTEVKNSKVSDSAFVYFVDKYGDDLATPKALGGYKIIK